MAHTRKAEVSLGGGCLRKSFAFLIKRAGYSEHCPSPLSAFPLLSAFNAKVAAGVTVVILKLGGDLQEGKAKTAKETLVLTLLRRKPTSGTACLWTSFYRRKINPSSLSCRSHLQPNTFLTDKQPEGYTHVHVLGVAELQKYYLKKTRCFSCL